MALRSRTFLRMIGSAVLCQRRFHTWLNGDFYSTTASPSQCPPQNARRSGGRFRRVARLHQCMLPAPFSLLDEWRGQVRSVRGRGVLSFIAPIPRHQPHRKHSPGNDQRRQQPVGNAHSFSPIGLIFSNSGQSVWMASVLLITPPSGFDWIALNQ